MAIFTKKKLKLKKNRIISRSLANNQIEDATFLKPERLYIYITDNKKEKENTFKIEILFTNK